MRLTYDHAVNAAYITLGNEPGSLKTVQVSDEVLIDFNANGVIYGIELLDARRQLGLGNELSLMIEAGGGSLALPLVTAE